MRVAFPPAIGIVYRSPRMSNAMVFPSGETSREIHDASSVVNLSERVVMSGNELVRVAARTALSFCAAVCATSVEVELAVRTSSRMSRDRKARGMRRLRREEGGGTETWGPRGAGPDPRQQRLR